MTDPETARHEPGSVIAWLVGDWSRWIRDPADLIRMSFLVGAFVTLGVGEPEQALRLFLTFLVSLVPRLLAAPRPFDAAFGIGMSLQAWGNLAHAFEGQGYDKLVHFVLPCAVAMLAYVGLVRARVLPELEAERGIHRLTGVAASTFAIGFAVAGAYELYEWFARQVFGAHLHVAARPPPLTRLAEPARASAPPRRAGGSNSPTRCRTRRRPSRWCRPPRWSGRRRRPPSTVT